jgi:hypothetical protein
MEIHRPGQEEAIAVYTVPGTIKEEYALPFQETVKLVFPGVVGMVTAMPGQPVATDQAVDMHRILYLHA